MRIDIISIFPEVMEQMLSFSIIQRAQTKSLLEIHQHNLRDYTDNNYKSVDDYPYGGGAGMVLKAEPIAKCIDALLEQRKYDEIIFPSPDGEVYKQNTVHELVNKKNIIILCGHYKGIDQRIRDFYVTKEISLGDYVLSGGELPAAIICDSIARLIPGVLGDESSALTDSFQDGLLSAPVYTRPAVFRELAVPKILLSGDDKKIQEWRNEMAYKKTKERRSDLLQSED
jgi:tRNA (guanine37-N1)-methyltransferase